MKYFYAAILGVLLGITFAQNEECQQDKVIACYFASWAAYRNETGNFTVNNIDPSLCTHLIYTFSGLNIDGKISALDPNLDFGPGGFSGFNALKKQNKCLKTLLAIGGWNEGSTKYSVMASTPESQDQFVESVLRFITHYGFDGFDFDWEYPASRGGLPEDKQGFVEILTKLKARLQKWNLLLTVAVPMNIDIINTGYNLTAIGNTVDFVFVMAYDFTTSESSYTGLIAPMTEVDKTVQAWLNSGINSRKLILGVPSYARTFNLANRVENGIGAPTDGMGIAGEYTLEPGFLSYYELQSRLLSEMYTIVKVDEEENYYAYRNYEWFTYEGEDTYQAKANYAKTNNLGGVMIWTIDTDDFLGEFGDPYPVLNAIKAVILG